MYRIRKKFRLEGAHILTSSHSKECQRIHGHSYIIEVFMSAETLNADGMVCDFGKLKEVVAPLIADWDHKLLYQAGQHLGSIGGVVVPFNPTAENMAKYLYDQIRQSVRQAHPIKVRVHETESGYAEYEETP